MSLRYKNTILYGWMQQFRELLITNFKLLKFPVCYIRIQIHT
jgi:hypothetical protein